VQAHTSPKTTDNLILTKHSGRKYYTKKCADIWIDFSPKTMKKFKTRNFIDLGLTLENGMVTYKGLYAPVRAFAEIIM